MKDLEGQYTLFPEEYILEKKEKLDTVNYFTFPELIELYDIPTHKAIEINSGMILGKKVARPDEECSLLRISFEGEDEVIAGGRNRKVDWAALAKKPIPPNFNERIEFDRYLCNIFDEIQEYYNINYDKAWCGKHPDKIEEITSQGRGLFENIRYRVNVDIRNFGPNYVKENLIMFEAFTREEKIRKLGHNEYANYMNRRGGFEFLKEKLKETA